MSGPKNNLEDVRRKKTLNTPDAPVPQAQQKVSILKSSNICVPKIMFVSAVVQIQARRRICGYLQRDKYVL
jgi:hypothetical protein